MKTLRKIGLLSDVVLLLAGAALVLRILAGPTWAAEESSTNDGAQQTAAMALPPSGAAPRVLVFTDGGLNPPTGGHTQGIQMMHDPQRQRYVAFLSHDSLLFGYLLVVEFSEDLNRPGRAIELHQFPSDGESPPLRHAGGIQVCDKVLAVGVEDNQQKTRSEVQFWDMTEPVLPRQYEHLTIRRKGEPEDQTAGGVGLARRQHDHVVAVANWDSKAIDFYLSNGKPLEDKDCRFALHTRWLAATANRLDWKPDQKVDAYQAVNLVSDAAGKILLLGFATTNRGQDIVDVFEVDLNQRDGDQMLQKVARQMMRLTAGSHFRHAGGWWHDGDRPAVLSSQRNLTPQTKLNLAR